MGRKELYARDHNEHQDDESYFAKRRRVFDHPNFTKLTSTEKVVLLVLMEFANPKTGRCWPGLETQCEMSKFNRGTVGRALKNIEYLDIIERERSSGGRGKPTVYIVKPYLETVAQRNSLEDSETVAHTHQNSCAETPKQLRTRTKTVAQRNTNSKEAASRKTRRSTRADASSSRWGAAKKKKLPFLEEHEQSLVERLARRVRMDEGLLRHHLADLASREGEFAVSMVVGCLDRKEASWFKKKGPGLITSIIRDPASYEDVVGQVAWDMVQDEKMDDLDEQELDEGTETDDQPEPETRLEHRRRGKALKRKSLPRVQLKEKPNERVIHDPDAFDEPDRPLAFLTSSDWSLVEQIQANSALAATQVVFKLKELAKQRGEDAVRKALQRLTDQPKADLQDRQFVRNVLENPDDACEPKSESQSVRAHQPTANRFSEAEKDYEARHLDEFDDLKSRTNGWHMNGVS